MAESHGWDLFRTPTQGRIWQVVCTCGLGMKQLLEDSIQLLGVQGPWLAPSTALLPSCCLQEVVLWWEVCSKVTSSHRDG